MNSYRNTWTNNWKKSFWNSSTNASCGITLATLEFFNESSRNFAWNVSTNSGQHKLHMIFLLRFLQVSLLGNLKRFQLGFFRYLLSFKSFKYSWRICSKNHLRNPSKVFLVDFNRNCLINPNSIPGTIPTFTG